MVFLPVHQSVPHQKSASTQTTINLSGPHKTHFTIHMCQVNANKTKFHLLQFSLLKRYDVPRRSWSSRFLWASTHLLAIEICEGDFFSSLYHLFQILITIQVQFPRNFYLQTKAVQLQPALGIVFLSSYSLGRRRVTSKFWVRSCFSCFFLSLLNSIVFKMKQLNCSRNRFTRRREGFSLAEGEFPSGTNIKVGV